MSKRGNGEGSIFQRKSDGRWVGEITLGKKADGKPKKKYIYGTSRAEVSSQMKTALADQQRGFLTEPIKTTFGDWLNRWLHDYSKLAVRKTTWESYESLVRVHIAPALGSIPLQKLNTSDIQRFLGESQVSGRADGKGGLSPITVRYLNLVIHLALEQAYREGLVPRNVSEHVKLPRITKKEIRPLTEDEIQRLLRANRSHRFYAALVLAVATGIRRGELLALRWDNVDLDNATITITESLVRVKGGYQFQEPKTKSSRRTIYLPEIAVKELKKRRKAWLESKLSKGSEFQETDLLFCQANGKPIDPRHFQRTFNEVWVKKAGLPPMRFHDLRHTHASHLLKQNVHIKVVQERLGHSNASTTLNTYSHLLPGMQKEAAEKLNTLLTST